MQVPYKTLLSVSLAAMLAACAAPPMGPTVQVLPASNKPFEVFQQDQAACQAYAQQQVAGQAEMANARAVGTAAIGTVLGVGLGAAIGNHQGAAVGGATGAMMGTSVAAGPTGGAQYSIQVQYNNAYVQCMYSKGNQVPGAPR